MADLAGLVASAAGGGVFGLIGTVAGRIAGVFERRQEQAHEQARWAHQLRFAEMNQKARAQELAGEAALADASGSWQSLAASISADAALPSGYDWVSAVRSLTRPVLTLLLWLITGGVYLSAEPESQAAIVETTTFAATAATLWWFGDRSTRTGR